jgi:cell division transport system permease protein
VRYVGIALVGAHVLITFSIILLIISIKVASRRDEISILQLVGATRGYIQAPFVIEGILYGVTGGIFAWGIAYLVLLYSMPFLVTFLAGIPILPPPILFMFEVLLGEIVLGAIIGGFGGLAAVRRFLKA